MNTTSEQILDAIAQQAGDWYAENRGGPLSHETREEFVAWLRASPQHVEEYLGVAAVARDLRVATDDPDFDVDVLLARARAGADNVVMLDRPQAKTSIANQYLNYRRAVAERSRNIGRCARWVARTVNAGVLSPK